MRVLRSLILVAAIAGLSGCDTNVFADPMQVRFSGGELQVRTCESVAATRIVVEARLDGDWEQIWGAGGGIDLVRGQVLGTSTLGEVFPTVQAAVDPAGEAGEELAVIIYSDADNQVSGFTVNEEAIGGEWIDPDGASNIDCGE